MSKKWRFFIIFLLIAVAGIYAGFKLLYYSPPPKSQDFAGQGEMIRLPEPVYKSGVSVEEALKKRRSVRDYSEEPLKLREVGQLLWAAQGITDQERGFRTAPSSLALYPLKIYVVASRVEGLPAGFYGYQPENHALVALAPYDYRNHIFLAVKQPAVKRAPVLLIVAGSYTEMERKMGRQKGAREMARFCVQAEAGHAAQNVYLQAVSLGLGTVSIGGFNDGEFKKLLGIEEEDVFYIMPVGKLE